MGFALIPGLPTLGPTELIIALVIILLLFGAKRIPELARGLGSGVREFREGTKEGQLEDKKKEEEKREEERKRDEEELSSESGTEADARAKQDATAEADHAEQKQR